MIATLNITIPLSDGSCELIRGEEVDAEKIPADTIAQMVRTGQLVDAIDEPPGDWRDASIGDLPLPGKLQSALRSAGFSTVRGVIEHAAAHGDDLTTISGIGDASAKSIIEAIESLEPKD